MKADAERLIAFWRECAVSRRRFTPPIDTNGKVLLVATADIYEQCADQLEAALKRPALLPPALRRLAAAAGLDLHGGER